MLPRFEAPLIRTGSSEHGIPSFDTDTYCYAYDCVQRKGIGIPRYRGWQRAEQAIDCDSHRACQNY